MSLAIHCGQNNGQQVLKVKQIQGFVELWCRTLSSTQSKDKFFYAPTKQALDIRTTYDAAGETSEADKHRAIAKDLDPNMAIPLT